MELKHIKLNIEMSPRAVDELKSIYSGKGVSKYELPLVIFPENQEFTADISIVDSMVWINIVCEDISVLLLHRSSLFNLFYISALYAILLLYNTLICPRIARFFIVSQTASFLSFSQCFFQSMTKL